MATAKIETRKPLYKCTGCEKSFSKLFDLTQHERCHTGEKPFACEICNKRFSQKSNMKTHLSAAHRVWPEALRTLQPVSKTYQVLDSIDKYCCQFCSLIIETYAGFKKHLVATHLNEKVFKCLVQNCLQTFSLLPDFIRHSKEHKDYLDDFATEEKKIWKCEICRSVFKRAEALQWHKSVESHSHVCAVCNTTFLRERYLRRHLATHRDPVVCSVCCKTIKDGKTLKNHMFLHQRQNGLVCDICDKSFANQYRLKRHYTVHAAKPLLCSYRIKYGCEKAFSRKDKLQEHVRTHVKNGQRLRKSSNLLLESGNSPMDANDKSTELNIQIYQMPSSQMAY